MSDTLSETTDTDELLDELRSWLADNWDPDLTVGRVVGAARHLGLGAPTLPADSFGRGLARSVGVQVTNEIAAFGAVGAPYGLGLLLAAPTIADHGTPEQIDTLVRDIVTGRAAWCQLFSEPGAGSDLAGLGTRAELDGDEWIVNGQKVWTSLGQTADCGMLIARTAPEAPKHQGISYFAIDMHQPGVEVRPLREMTGHAMFNETFLTDARVPADRAHRRAQQGLGRGQHHPRLRAGGTRHRRRQPGDDHHAGQCGGQSGQAGRRLRPDAGQARGRRSGSGAQTSAPSGRPTDRARPGQRDASPIP